MREYFIPLCACILIALGIVGGTAFVVSRATHNHEQRRLAAFNFGYEAAEAGVSPQANPYPANGGSNTLRIAWLKGWMEGNND